MEYEQRADELKQDTERMEQEAERVGGVIDETRQDWESKQEDQQVPGAQPDMEEELRQQIEEEREEREQIEREAEQADEDDEEE